MGVAVSGCLFVWAVGGLGRLEGLLLRKGGWSCLVGWFSRVWLACPCWYRRHTLCCLCLVVVGAPFCVLGACGGGMLSGFWGSAPWLPDPCSAALCGWWGWVWVGWL